MMTSDPLTSAKAPQIKDMPADWQVPEYEVSLWRGVTKPWCIVIPVINEGKRIHSLLERMAKLQVSAQADILIVDGGSTDGSLERDYLIGVGVTALVVKTGPGKLGSQLRCAYAVALQAGYKGIVTIDGNDKDDPEAIPAFIAALENGVDFAQASRFIASGRGENTPFVRELAIRLIHAPALGFFSGFGWTDTTQGFRGYSRRMLLDPRVGIFRDVFTKYELLAYLSYRVPRLGYTCCELPSCRHYPKDEQVPTKIKGLRGNVDLLKTLWTACTGGYNPREGSNPSYAAGAGSNEACRDASAATRRPLRLLGFGGAFLVLFLMFFLNMFSTAIYQGFDVFETFSEQLVVNRIEATIAKGQGDRGGFLIEPDQSAYPSQYGLQGRILGPIAVKLAGPSSTIAAKLQGHKTPVTRLDILLLFLHAIVAASTAAVVTGMLWWASREFGASAAVAGLAGIIFCPAFIVFGRNLYWVPATWLLPFLLTACWFVFVRLKNVALITNVVALFVCGFVSLYIKSLCGYEFVTTMTLAGCVPVFYYGLKYGWSKARMALLIVVFGVGSVVGFGAALVTHGYAVAQMEHKSSVWSGLEHVKDRAAIRVCGNHCKDIADPKFTGDLVNRANQSYAKVVSLYLFSPVQGRILNIPAIIWIGVLGFATRRLLKRPGSGDAALAVAAWVSVLAPLSWYVLAKPHATMHTHLSFGLWSVPFTFMVSIAIYRAWFSTLRVSLPRASV